MDVLLPALICFVLRAHPSPAWTAAALWNNLRKAVQLQVGGRGWWVHCSGASLHLQELWCRGPHAVSQRELPQSSEPPLDTSLLGMPKSAGPMLAIQCFLSSLCFSADAQNWNIRAALVIYCAKPTHLHPGPIKPTCTCPDCCAGPA